MRKTLCAPIPSSHSGQLDPTNLVDYDFFRERHRALLFFVAVIGVIAIISNVHEARKLNNIEVAGIDSLAQCAFQLSLVGSSASFASLRRFSTRLVLDERDVDTIDLDQFKSFRSPSCALYEHVMGTGCRRETIIVFDERAAPFVASLANYSALVEIGRKCSAHASDVDDGMDYYTEYMLPTIVWAPALTATREAAAHASVAALQRQLGSDEMLPEHILVAIPMDLTESLSAPLRWLVSQREAVIILESARLFFTATEGYGNEESSDEEVCANARNFRPHPPVIVDGTIVGQDLSPLLNYLCPVRSNKNSMRTPIDVAGIVLLIDSSGTLASNGTTGGSQSRLVRQCNKRRYCCVVQRGDDVRRTMSAALGRCPKKPGGDFVRDKSGNIIKWTGAAWLAAVPFARAIVGASVLNGSSIEQATALGQCGSGAVDVFRLMRLGRPLIVFERANCIGEWAAMLPRWAVVKQERVDVHLHTLATYPATMEHLARQMVHFAFIRYAPPRIINALWSNAVERRHERHRELPQATIELAPPRTATSYVLLQPFVSDQLCRSPWRDVAARIGIDPRSAIRTAGVMFGIGESELRTLSRFDCTNTSVSYDGTAVLSSESPLYPHHWRPVTHAGAPSGARLVPSQRCWNARNLEMWYSSTLYIDVSPVLSGRNWSRTLCKEWENDTRSWTAAVYDFLLSKRYTVWYFTGAEYWTPLLHEAVSRRVAANLSEPQPPRWPFLAYSRAAHTFTFDWRLVDNIPLHVATEIDMYFVMSPSYYTMPGARASLARMHYIPWSYGEGRRECPFSVARVGARTMDWRHVIVSEGNANRNFDAVVHAARQHNFTALIFTQSEKSRYDQRRFRRVCPANDTRCWYFDDVPFCECVYAEKHAALSVIAVDPISKKGKRVAGLIGLSASLKEGVPSLAVERVLGDWDGLLRSGVVADATRLGAALARVRHNPWAYDQLLAEMFYVRDSLFYNKVKLLAAIRQRVREHGIQPDFEHDLHCS